MHGERVKPTFYEFFAGGGMARAGLGDAWRCLFANDFDEKKGQTYRRNWGDKELVVQDVRSIELTQLPDTPDLVWASFPCQDLSLAGGGAGLRGDRSGTFWPFWRIMSGLIAEGRGPKMIVLENVCGTLTSHGGKDFAAICDSLAAHYRVGAVIADAAHFIPQSRPRLFVIGVEKSVSIPPTVVQEFPHPTWHPRGIINAYAHLAAQTRHEWVWWRLPEAPPRKQRLLDIVEINPPDVSWHTPEETQKWLDMMSPLNRKKVEQAIQKRTRVVGAIYRRTRKSVNGDSVQRAEVRFDDLSGCLRTPAGGSSRQVLFFVDGGKLRSRLTSGRETARLMGLPDNYKLPERYNDTYHLTGDGVAVPVVQHISKGVLLPIILQETERMAA